MQIVEIRKIELSSEELENIIKRGLGVPKASAIKLSFKIPQNIKVSVETKSNVTEIQPIETQPNVIQNPASINGNTKQVTINPNDKVCGNCIYPYPTGESLFCEISDRTVRSNESCRNFEFKPKENK